LFNQLSILAAVGVERGLVAMASTAELNEVNRSFFILYNELQIPNHLVAVKN
jgi:cyclophilin family peptidyl-prolyl cis-trans isomerase